MQANQPQNNHNDGLGQPASAKRFRRRGFKPRDLILWPYWLASLFTTAKNFRDNPLVGSPLLNRLGLHRLRCHLANRLTLWRQWLLAPLVSREQRRTFQRDGILVVEDFLKLREVREIRDYFKWHQGPARRMVQNQAWTDHLLLDDSVGRGCKALDKVRKGWRLRRLLMWCGSRLYVPTLFLHRIHNRAGSADFDPQKSLHADTFHPTIKAWLFLEDVTPDKGPFTYIKGSHRPTPARLAWEQALATGARTTNEVLSLKGSMRLDDAGRRAMDLAAPTALTVRAGTLVIANTQGFHGRGIAHDGATRLAIWTSNRANPFNPLPLGLLIPQGLQARAIRWWWRRADARARAAGKQPTWRAIDARDMLD